MQQAHFITPDPTAFPSGGNVYNARLIEAIVRAGVHVSHDAFHPNWTLSSQDTLYVLDSYYFENITEPVLQIPEPCVGLIHHLNSLFPDSVLYFTEKEKPILDRMSGYIVSSRFTQQYLSSRGYDNSSIVRIEPAPSLVRYTRTSFDKNVRALMLGSCIPRKGQLEFLTALAASDIPPLYSIVVAGSLNADPVYAEKCSEVIHNDERLKSCVHLIGEQDSAAINNLYMEPNLFLSASFMETFGMAIQDAAVCGLPLLALEGGYAAEHIVSDINGVRCTSPEHLVQEFERCVTDPDYFVSLQKGAATFEPQYQTWDQGANTFIKTCLRDHN